MPTNKIIPWLLKAVVVALLMVGAYIAGQHSTGHIAALPVAVTNETNAIVRSTPGTPISGKITAVGTGKFTVDAADPFTPGVLHSTDVYFNAATKVTKISPGGLVNPLAANSLTTDDLLVGDMVSVVPVQGADNAKIFAMQITLMPASSVTGNATTTLPKAAVNTPTAPPVPANMPK